MNGILDHICKPDAISVVGYIYRDLNNLLFARRGHNKISRNFEIRFAVLVKTFNRNSHLVLLSKSLRYLMLLYNVWVDSSQRI